MVAVLLKGLKGLGACNIFVDDEYAGFIQNNYAGHNGPIQLGYGIENRTLRHRGIMTEAVRLYLQPVSPLQHDVSAWVAFHNPFGCYSISVLEKNGFEKSHDTSWCSIFKWVRRMQ